MDRLALLSRDLSAILDQLHEEAARRNVNELAAPLAWLDEAHGWLRYELERTHLPEMRDPVPFTYIPLELRR